MARTEPIRTTAPAIGNDAGIVLGRTADGAGEGLGPGGEF